MEPKPERKNKKKRRTHSKVLYTPWYTVPIVVFMGGGVFSFLFLEGGGVRTMAHEGCGGCEAFLVSPTDSMPNARGPKQK